MRVWPVQEHPEQNPAREEERHRRLRAHEHMEAAGESYLKASVTIAVERDWKMLHWLLTLKMEGGAVSQGVHSSVLAWRIPGIGEPGGLQSMGSHRVGHD